MVDVAQGGFHENRRSEVDLKGKKAGELASKRRHRKKQPTKKRGGRFFFGSPCS